MLPGRSFGHLVLTEPTQASRIVGAAEEAQVGGLSNVDKVLLRVHVKFNPHRIHPINKVGSREWLISRLRGSWLKEGRRIPSIRRRVGLELRECTINRRVERNLNRVEMGRHPIEKL